MKFNVNAFVSADVCQAAVEQSPAHRATLNQRRRKVAEKQLRECTGLSWGTSETLSCVYASDHAVTCMGGFLLFLFFHSLLHKWKRHKGACPLASCYASQASARYIKVASKVHKFWRRQKHTIENKLLLFKLWCLVLYYLIYGKLYRASKRCKKKFALIAHHVKLVYINATSFIYHRLPSLRVSAMVVFLWLFMSGDIELNPGPGRGHLTTDDLRVVRKAIWDARSKWFSLGIELKMSVNTLEAIKLKNKENPNDCLTEMLLEWLKQANPKPTWSCIVAALREPTVGLEQLAESIDSENQQLKAVHNKDLTTSENEASCSSGIKLGKRRTRDKLCFPHIDEIAPDKEHRKALEERLQIESKEIMFKFYILVNKFFDSLEEQAIPAQKLERYLRMPLGTEKLTINTVQDAQDVIEANSSFYDYQLVEYMIEVAGTENDRQALQKYKESFIHYAQRRVFECPAKLATRTSGDIKLMIKLDSHYKCKLAELKEFQERVCQILQIPIYVSKLHCVKKGCFQITFLIPSYIQKIAFPLTSEQKSDLAKLKVLCLICGEFREVFRKGGAEMDHNMLDSESDSDDDCETPIVKSIGSEVEDLIHQISFTELADKTSSVDQIGSSRIVRTCSIGRSERRRQAGRSAASPTSSPTAGSPLRTSPTMWNFDSPPRTAPQRMSPRRMSPTMWNYDSPSRTPPRRMSSTMWNFDSPSRTPPRRMSPMSEYSHSLRIFPSIDSSFFRHSTSIEPVSRGQGTLPHDLLVAAANGEILNIAILINLHNIDVHYKDSQGNSALHYAAMYGHLNVIEYLIRHGARITDLGQDEMSLLHIASKFNHMHIVHFLISKHDINPCCLDHYKRTPFFIACMYGRLEIAQYLLRALLQYKVLEDTINSKDALNETVIHAACKMGHIEIVKWLVSGLNCDPNNIVPGWMNRTPLHYAAENGHVHIIKLLIEDLGCNPSCTDNNGFTPLQLASFNGHIKVVKYLTREKHCDPMFKDNFNNTSLHAAACNGQITIVTFLISVCNCDPRLPGKDNRTPLHYAAENGHLHVVRYLTEQENCDPTCLDRNKFTPLHLASMAGHLETIKYLTLERHCDPEVRSSGNETPLHVATVCAQLNVVRFLISDLKCDPNTPGLNNRTPLHHAAQEGHLHIVKFLIEEQHCDPECVDRNNATPLHLASMKGCLNIISHLVLEKGCNVSCRNSNNETILHVAAFNGHLDLVRFMISNLHCDPNTQGWKDTNSTPLHYAAQEGHLQIVKYLIEEQQCNPECQNGDRVTPLHFASLKGHLDTVKYLVLEKCCDPKCRNSNNQTPLHYAVINGQLDWGGPELVKFFISELKCDPNSLDTDGTLLHYAAHEGHLHIVKYLIEEQTCDPACLDRNSTTPLHLASMNGYLDVIKYLIVDKNCDPSVRNSNNATPLHIATHNGHYDVIKFLISGSNCDPNTPGWNNRTPLHLAAQEGHLKIAKYLIEERHCDPSCQDIDKFTPLHFASLNGQLNIVKYLIEEQKCNPEYQNVNKVTPLYLASEKGHLDLVKYLTLKKCCDITGRTGNHNTPLHVAAANGNLEVVKFFISTLNCNPHIPGFIGLTPLHYSIHSGNIPLVKYMVEEVKCNLQALDNFRRAPVMATSKHLPCLQYLCEIGCDPTVTDMHGATLLHLAAQEEIVDYLIREHHFDPNTPGWTSRTPLHCAAERGHLNLLNHLIMKYSCQPTLTDANGDTPLHFAAAQGHLPVIKHLTLDLNSDSMQTDNYGNTALHDAARNGHLEVVKFLVETLHCPVNTRGSCHMTPLEWAFFKGHFHVVKYLNQVEDRELMILGD